MVGRARFVVQRDPREPGQGSLDSSIVNRQVLSNNLSKVSELIIIDKVIWIMQ